MEDYTEDSTKVNSAADIKEFMEAGELRLDTAQKITNNRDSIVQETLAQLKVNDTSINQKYDACVEHLNFLLNGITYAVMAGNESAIDQYSSVKTRSPQPPFLRGARGDLRGAIAVN